MFWEEFTSRVRNLGEDSIGIGYSNETIYDSKASSRRGPGPSRHFPVDFMDLLGCFNLGFKGLQSPLCHLSEKEIKAAINE